ncbi:MAG: hypothetical protein ISS72_07640, partial [Candidatus Brocadiae bacterium]|nr:hypothetical protein [Candidatus Brocadiia bacterium]
MTHNHRTIRIASVVLASSMLTGSAAGVKPAADYVWVEGEAPQSQSMTRHPWWYDKVKTHLLSNADFISNWSAKQGEATYTFAIPATKKHTFWVRANT